MAFSKFFLAEFIENCDAKLADINVRMLKHTEDAFQQTFVNTVAQAIGIGCKTLDLVQVRR